jgi:hypothetical protein
MPVVATPLIRTVSGDLAFCDASGSSAVPLSAAPNERIDLDGRRTPTAFVPPRFDH